MEHGKAIGVDAPAGFHLSADFSRDVWASAGGLPATFSERRYASLLYGRAFAPRQLGVIEGFAIGLFTALCVVGGGSVCVRAILRRRGYDVEFCDQEGVIWLDERQGM